MFVEIFKLKSHFQLSHTVTMKHQSIKTPFWMVNHSSSYVKLAKEQNSFYLRKLTF